MLSWYPMEPQAHPCLPCSPSPGAALTVEAHIVVGQDGRAVPLGRAPDDHVQQPIGGLNVVFLGKRRDGVMPTCPKTSFHSLLPCHHTLHCCSPKWLGPMGRHRKEEQLSQEKEKLWASQRG